MKLSAFIGRIAAGRIELYSDLSMSTSIEMSESDVIHVVEGETPTEPSLLFVRKDADVVVRTRSIADALPHFGSPGGCACQSEEDEGPAMLARQRGPSAADIRCLAKRNACLINCAFKHSDDPLMRAACLDSCDAALRLCKSVGGTSGPVIF